MGGGKKGKIDSLHRSDIFPSLWSGKGLNILPLSHSFVSFFARNSILGFDRANQIKIQSISSVFEVS